MNGFNGIGFLLVARFCLTSGILTKSFSVVPSRAASSSPSPYAYLPTTAAPKLRDSEEYDPIDPHAKSHRNSGFLACSPRKEQGESHEYERFSLNESCVPDKSTAKAPRKSSSKVAMTVTVPRRSLYHVSENIDDHPSFSQHETYHDAPKDPTTAIKLLDEFLKEVLNNESYNSELHPPPNPVLALVLSRYGRYIPGPRNYRVYAHMAVNNIHNNKPFGKYKQERNEETRVTRECLLRQIGEPAITTALVTPR